MKKKNTAPTMKQWSILYEVASAIKAQAPWQNLWDNDLFTIMIPGYEEPVYISVMGRNGECYGIGVYPGHRSINALYRLLDASEDSPVSSLAFQNCLMCYYGNREELFPKEREIIKSLGLKFRGKNNWIFFRSIEEGFYPWHISAEQAGLLIQALQNFSMAYMHYSEGKIKVDFEGGQTLMRIYSEERGEWLNAAVPLPPAPEMTAEVAFKDELLLRRLKNKQKDSAILELDILYLPMPVQDKPDEAPYFPRVIALLDNRSGELLAQQMLDKKTKNEDAICEILINYVTENKKPAKLLVRDKYFLGYVGSLCSQLEILVTCNKGVPRVDGFFEEMIEFMGNR